MSDVDRISTAAAAALKNQDANKNKKIIIKKEIKENK